MPFPETLKSLIILPTIVDVFQYLVSEVNITIHYNNIMNFVAIFIERGKKE